MNDLRGQIDEIDQKIVELLGKRMVLVKEIGQLKETTGSEIQDEEREKEIKKRLKDIAEKEGLDEEFVNHLYTHIFIESRKIQEFKN